MQEKTKGLRLYLVDYITHNIFSRVSEYTRGLHW
jgi:hypothetical protein